MHDEKRARAPGTHDKADHQADHHADRQANHQANHQAAGQAEFRVTAMAARLALMRQLRDSGAPVLLQSPDGSTMNTSLWSLDDQRQRLSFTGNVEHPHLQALLESAEVAATAYLDNVKLQFELDDLVLVRGTQAVCLQAMLPTEVFRFQRRGAYRVRLPDRQLPVATFRHPSMPEMQLSLRVLDVSASGCSLWLPADVPPLQPGTVLSRVVVVLDESTRFSATVTLQHVMALASADNGQRLGCEWQPSSPASARTLQRWVDTAQRRSRLFKMP